MSNSVEQAATVKSSLIKINSASQDDLQTIQGIGPLLSARIIEYRSKVGSISHKDQLHAIKGMRAHQIERMANLIDWSENHTPGGNKPPSRSPGIILVLCALVISLYLTYPMVDLFFEEFTHWENNLLHWYTNTVNLLAIVFTISLLLLALAWLLSLFYVQSAKLAKVTRILLIGTISGFFLLLTASAAAYFVLDTRVDVTAYMLNLLIVVIGVLILIYLQFLPQLLYLSRKNKAPGFDKLYDYSMAPLSIGLLIYSAGNPIDSLPMDIFLLWVAVLLSISSLTLLQRRSCFAELLQELSGWPNILQNQGDAALNLGHAIQHTNQLRSTSRIIVFAGAATLIFSLAAGFYNLYNLANRFIY